MARILYADAEWQAVGVCVVLAVIIMYETPNTIDLISCPLFFHFHPAMRRRCETENEKEIMTKEKSIETTTKNHCLHLLSRIDECEYLSLSPSHIKHTHSSSFSQPFYGTSSIHMSWAPTTASMSCSNQ